MPTYLYFIDVNFLVLFFSVFTVLKINSRDPSQSSHFMTQAVQLISMLPYSDLEFEKYMLISANGKASETFPVVVSSLNLIKLIQITCSSNSDCGLFVLVGMFCVVVFVV